MSEIVKRGKMGRKGKNRSFCAGWMAGGQGWLENKGMVVGGASRSPTKKEGEQKIDRV